MTDHAKRTWPMKLADEEAAAMRHLAAARRARLRAQRVVVPDEQATRSLGPEQLELVADALRQFRVPGETK